MWWRDAVFYEVYIRSFADSDGDGVGDLDGLRSKLDHLVWLGVDAVWITPFYRSPMIDHGYDVADYRDVDPLFGTLADFDRLLDDAHARGLKVIVDVVPNHTSVEHGWFKQGLWDRYLFRDEPNNWGSVFGGPAWTYHPPAGRYYLHLFAPEQPDLNWRNPAVHAEFSDVFRFWLDRGVDGFRIDVAHGLYKDEMLRDNPELPARQAGATAYMSLEQRYNWDQPEVHDVYREWRKVLDSYAGDRMAVGEVFLLDQDRVSPYVRPDELHLAFNFLLLGAKWDAADLRRCISATVDAMTKVDATPTWVLSNHDITRHRTRFGGSIERARAAALVLLALPGTAFVYQGDELGLPEADVSDAARQDPIFARTGGEIAGRDGCRVPIPWTSSGPGYGFTSGSPWLPFPTSWGSFAADASKAEGASIANLYRRAIALRRQRTGAFAWIDADPDVLAFRRGDLVCMCNLGRDPVPIDGEVLLSSGRLSEGALEPDTAVWLGEAPAP